MGPFHSGALGARTHVRLPEVGDKRVLVQEWSRVVHPDLHPGHFIVATVDPGDAGAASGVIGTAQRVGSAIGIAIIGTVVFGTPHINSAGPTAVALAFAHSATLAMAESAGLSVAAFALVFALPRRMR